MARKTSIASLSGATSCTRKIVAPFLLHTASATPIEFTIFGEIEGNYQDINRRFESGIFADVTGSAEYTVVFK